MIELLKEFVWPAFLGSLIYIYRENFRSLLEIIKKRIEDGSEVVVGPGGISIKEVPKLPDNPSPEDEIDDEPCYSDKKVPKTKRSSTDFNSAQKEALTLVHTSSFWKIKKEKAYYRVFVNIDSSDQRGLDDIEKVIYLLHPTFKNPRRVVQTRDDNFLLKTNCWGEFSLKAEVYLKNDKEPLLLERYISIRE